MVTWLFFSSPKRMRWRELFCVFLLSHAGRGVSEGGSERAGVGLLLRAVGVIGVKVNRKSW